MSTALMTGCGENTLQNIVMQNGNQQLMKTSITTKNDLVSLSSSCLRRLSLAVLARLLRDPSADFSPGTASIELESLRTVGPRLGEDFPDGFSFCCFSPPINDLILPPRESDEMVRRRQAS